MKNGKLFLLTQLFVIPISAVEIINNTSKTVYCTSFGKPEKYGDDYFGYDYYRVLSPLDIEPGEKIIKEDTASLDANIPGINGTYVFNEIDRSTSISFIELANNITVIESKEEQDIIAIEKYPTSWQEMEKRKDFDRAEQQKKIKERQQKQPQFFKEYLRQNYEKIKSKLGSFDKENDKYYRFGVQLGYRALRIAYQDTFFESLTDKQIKEENEQFKQELERMAIEFKDAGEHWIKLLKEKNTAATENMYNKWFLGLTSVYENDQILEKSLEHIDCPQEKIKTVLESGNCQINLWNMVGAMMMNTLDCQNASALEKKDLPQEGN